MTPKYRGLHTKAPKWIVNYNIVSPENNRWIGTGWEFFDTEEEATYCYNRHLGAGNVPCKRPYYHTDGEYLGAAHIELRSRAKKYRRERHNVI